MDGQARCQGDSDAACSAAMFHVMASPVFLTITLDLDSFNAIIKTCCLQSKNRLQHPTATGFNPPRLFSGGFFNVFLSMLRTLCFTIYAAPS